MNDKNSGTSEDQTTTSVVTNIGSTIATSSLPDKARPAHTATMTDTHRSPIYQALEELDEAITNLDHELAEFYDDIAPVLAPSIMFDNGISHIDKDASEISVNSKITDRINDKRQLLDRIRLNLETTRKRIEL